MTKLPTYPQKSQPRRASDHVNPACWAETSSKLSWRCTRGKGDAPPQYVPKDQQFKP